MFQVSKEEGKRLIENRVEAFERNTSAYKSPAYNEEQARMEFINPLFEAFGWDVRNVSGFAEAYKDVIHEETLRMRVGAHAAPDYTFRIGGRRVFFVEAKKPAENIKENPRLVYQLRRYGWSAGLNLSILTDFEELAVYDCRFRPKEGDKVGIGRVDYLRYDQYLDRFEDLYGLFGKEAVMQGSLERYAESTKRQRGTAPVDKEFLKEIERWRDLLARNIALRNPNLSVRQLNFAVQRTIDRIIFLRICEDRGIEHYGRLQSLGNGTNVYERLLERFDRAEERYNSGLFHFQREKGEATEPDELSPSLAIDDKALKEIFKAIYFPASPYEFSVIGADILGQVYEQFLGKVIRLTPAHHAKVEDKPEVRKAGGVYYTPTYIVDYIVRNTVGRLCEGEPEEGETGKQVNGGRRFLLEPKQVKKLRILDPACGSGSFLIGAYQFLLDYCRDWYVANDPAKHKKAVYQGAGGQWFLTPAEKKEILLGCIHGVDIDTQAVEVTKLNLLLKALEGESRESLEQQMLFHRERALPDLGGNIKCGNSLIGSDFFDHHQGALFDDEELRRINPFDWDGPDGFPEILKRGGFDAVIGNPPYGNYLSDAESAFLIEKSILFASIRDGYVAFIDKAHAVLSEGGLFGYIVPSAWLGGPAYYNLRAYLILKSMVKIVMLPYDVFSRAYIDTVILVTRNTPPAIGHCVNTYEYPKRFSVLMPIPFGASESLIEQSCWNQIDGKKFVVDAQMASLITRLRNERTGTLGDVVEMRRGVLFDPTMLSESRLSSRCYRYFEGNIYRYLLEYKADRWVEYGSGMREYPREFRWFEGDRILLRRLVNRKMRLMACHARETFITNKNLYSIKVIGNEPIEYILGVINSSLISRIYLAEVSQAAKDDFPQVTIRDIMKMPYITFHDAQSGNELCANVIDCVREIMTLNEGLARENNINKKRHIEARIDKIDRKIDILICGIYGLSDEEIAIVEEGVKR